MKYQAVRGTSDILPLEVWKWRFLEETARKVFGIFGYEEIRTPIFESTELFLRSIGETTDIVEKQMYTIPPPALRPKGPTGLPSANKAGGGTIPEEGGMGLTLRPEATAPVVRAFLEHGLYHEDRIHKFFYIGPMFRHERPQKGRLRQFHQIGVEVFGSTYPTVDAEVLDLLSSLLKEVGLEGALFKINSVGCRSCKSKYGELLRESLRPRLGELCFDCQRRFEKNVLRVLDCKNENCQNVLAKIPLLPEVLCEECKNHFQKLLELLRALGVAFELAPKLVRGLDYYTRTIFEVTHSSLGAQDAIAAGGRYDLLVESLGGPSLGAVGFGIGIERLILALGEKFASGKGPYKPLFFLASLGENAFRSNFLLHKDLRNLKIPCEMDYDSKSLKSQLRRANRLGIRYVLLRGDDEMTRSVVKLKDMEKGMEEEIEVSRIANVIRERFDLFDKMKPS